MFRHKCAECGLVNFADQECCKRCNTPLRKFTPRPDERRDIPIRDPEVGTYNGIGTRLLGWRHYEDGTATATVWFTLFFLPIFPMDRWRLFSPTKDDFEPAFSLRQIFAYAVPYGPLTTNYCVLDVLRMSGKEILFTYLYAYAWVPFKIAVPFWLIFHFRPAPDERSMTPTLIPATLSSIWFGYVLVMLTRLFHQTRGGRN
jgi:hypothetical protein